MQRIVCIAHVHYPDLWPELAACMKIALKGGGDAIITYSDESSVRQARADLPDARFVRCENVGFDIWPFLKVLGEIDLSGYTYVVKLHTKRDVPPEPRIEFNGMDCTGPAWRNELLSFVSTPEAWRASLAKIAEPEVSAVAGLRCILRRRDVPMQPTRAAFDRALELARAIGLDPADPQFVGGTMFIMRAECLRPLQGRWRASDFSAPQGHETRTLAHLVERIIGFCACGGGRISDPFGALARYRRKVFWLRCLRGVVRFAWQAKRTRNGRLLIKVLRVPVWRSGRGKGRVA